MQTQHIDDASLSQGIQDAVARLARLEARRAASVAAARSEEIKRHSVESVESWLPQ